jgi:hypothetical protein
MVPGARRPADLQPDRSSTPRTAALHPDRSSTPRQAELHPGRPSTAAGRITPDRPTTAAAKAAPRSSKHRDRQGCTPIVQAPRPASLHPDRSNPPATRKPCTPLAPAHPNPKMLHADRASAPRPTRRHPDRASAPRPPNAARRSRQPRPACPDSRRTTKITPRRNGGTCGVLAHPNPKCCTRSHRRTPTHQGRTPIAPAHPDPQSERYGPDHELIRDCRHEIGTCEAVLRWPAHPEPQSDTLMAGAPQPHKVVPGGHACAGFYRRRCARCLAARLPGAFESGVVARLLPAVAGIAGIRVRAVVEPAGVVEIVGA